MRYSFFLLLFLSFQHLYAQQFATEIQEHREKYKADFLNNPQAPLKAADFGHLHFFDADSNYRIVSTVTLLKNQKVFHMPTYDGTSKEFIRYARIKFKLGDQQLELTLYRNMALAINPAYKDYLFLPFTDLTNGKESYGGGRYLDLRISDIQNEQLIIDFNKVYNPYCAYSDGYRCPVPPEENDLAVAIVAGEKMYTGDKKKRTP